MIEKNTINNHEIEEPENDLIISDADDLGAEDASGDSAYSNESNNFKRSFGQRFASLSFARKAVIIGLLILPCAAIFYIFFHEQNSPVSVNSKADITQEASVKNNFDQLTQSIADGMTSKSRITSSEHAFGDLDAPKMTSLATEPMEPSSIHDIDSSTLPEPKSALSLQVRQSPQLAPLPPSPLEVKSTKDGGPKPSTIMSRLSQDDEKAAAAKKSKMQSNIFVFGGERSADSEKKNIDSSKVDIFTSDADNVLEDSSSPKTVAKIVRNLDRTILEGKIIDAVLESAINSSVPSGIIRAIVSRDTYSEQSKNILVPKGSRLVGTYNSTIKAGQSRVEIMWTRLITPAGIDIKIDSAGADALGRSGIRGIADTKWLSKLANAFLISYVVPYASAAAMDSLNEQVVTSATTGVAPFSGGAIPPGGNSGVNNIPSTVTTTSSVKAQIAQDAMESFQQTATDVIKQHFSDQTVVIVPQGQIVKVLVMKDVVFASNAIANSHEGVLMN